MNKLLGCFKTCIFMAGRTTRLNHVEGLEVELENMTVERGGNCKALANAMVDHAELQNLAKSCKAVGRSLYGGDS